jgi:hypothetical protein
MGIYGALSLGILASLASIGVSVVSIADGTYKEDNTDYKSTWRFIYFFLKLSMTIFIGVVLFQINFINKKTIISRDYGWRNIILRTFAANFIHLILCFFNALVIEWGEGPLVHVARVKIEIINIALTFGIGFLFFSRTLFSHHGSRDVKHTMDNNEMFKFVQTILNIGKVPEKDNREEKAQALASANETVDMLNAQKNTQNKKEEKTKQQKTQNNTQNKEGEKTQNNTQNKKGTAAVAKPQKDPVKKKAFGERQRRRNPSKRRKKRK